MGLFDKKFCDVCGEKIKFLGNRKLEDGNLCKDCSSKLSPWFSDRRRSTVQDIKDQLAYREENQAKVEAFNTTRTIGEYYMVHLDEDAKTFCVAQARDVRTGNPDILDFAQVTGCDLDIDETKDEVTREDAEGKSVSYDPPRYDYRYDFYVRLRVNHPWFDEMRFKINSHTVDIAYGSNMPSGHGAPAGRPGAPAGRPGVRPSVQRAVAFDPTTNAEYQQYVAMGNEVKEAILQVRQEARDEIAAQNAPKTAVICPCCGASTIPDANGCCEYCGGAIGG